jgi:hypothetical protein
VRRGVWEPEAEPLPAAQTDDVEPPERVEHPSSPVQPKPAQPWVPIVLVSKRTPNPAGS